MGALGRQAGAAEAAGDWRVLVVDDDVIFRRALSKCLADALHGAEVQTAATVAAARKRIQTERFDLVTLDLTLTDGDASTLLPWLRDAYPGLPVIVVTGGSARVPTEVDAILLGATRMIIKPGGPNAQDALYRAMSPVIAELARARRGRALRAERHATPAPWLDPAAANDQRSLAPRSNSRGAPLSPPQESESERPPSATRREVIAIGASTGGPPVIVSLLRALPPAFATPIVVTQHMPASHVSYFVDLLIARAGRMVRVPEDGELLERATVYVAGPRGHLVVSRRDGRLRLRHDDGPPEHQCKPAVDPMFRSVAEACGPAALAVVMSGMGADGAMGALAMRQRGAAVIVQDEASSAVWGMPGAAVAAGAADHVAAASELAPWVLRLTQADNPIDAQGRR